MAVQSERIRKLNQAAEQPGRRYVLYWTQANRRVDANHGLLYAVDLPGNIHCLDAATGKPYWVYETGAETWGTPLVADGKVYLTNKRGLIVMAAGKEPKLISTVTLGSQSYATPVTANGTLFVASKGALWAVQRGGHGEAQ